MACGGVACPVSDKPNKLRRLRDGAAPHPLGRWLLQVDRIERLESCAPRVHNQPVGVVRVEELGL